MSGFRFELVVRVKFVPTERGHPTWHLTRGFYLETGINRLRFKSCPEPRTRLVAHQGVAVRQGINSEVNSLCSRRAGGRRTWAACGSAERADWSRASEFTTRCALLSPQAFSERPSFLTDVSIPTSDPFLKGLLETDPFERTHLLSGR